MLIVFTVDLIDGANFQAKMCSTRAFDTYAAAHTYGQARRDHLRSKRIAEGETDELFVEAIVYEVHEVELNNGSF